MDSERFARLREAFDEAWDLGGAERAIYLAGVRRKDPDFCRELEALLAADDGPSRDLVSRSLEDVALDESAREHEGPRTIGGYRILGVCGSGGMGTVYEAEQPGPEPRRVALKVLQAPFPSKELRSRFRREARILSRLEHPGIAKIFEAGECEEAGVTRPYIAMEFVDGDSLLRYATKRALSVQARVELFLKVCDAIEHAHIQGVVHRDLKPDNILVAEPVRASGESLVAEPKVLDFGVGRVTDSENSAMLTLATGDGQLLGSLPYMSPEQAVGDLESLDRRSDIYSLGIVFFELLTGQLPYPVRKRALADALHTIRHAEPSRLGNVDADLRGDLDTIVGKCIEKEPEKRYESVAALISDLRRHLKQLPIQAKPPTAWRTLRKFASRHRAFVGGFAATLLAIVAGAVVAVLFALEASKNAELSSQEAYRANLASASALLDSDPSMARRTLARVPEHLRGWEWRVLSESLSGLLLVFGETHRRENNAGFALPREDMYVHAAGERVLATTSEREFSIWETRSGRCIRRFEAPGLVGSYALSADASTLVAVLDERTVVKTEIGAEASGTAKLKWETLWQGGAAIYKVAVGPRGEQFAFSGAEGLRYGRPGAWKTKAVPEHAESARWVFPHTVCFDHAGERLAANLFGLVVIQVASGAETLVRSTQQHLCQAFSPEPRGQLASGQLRREIRLYDADTGALEAELTGNTQRVLHVEYGPSSKLVSVSADGIIRLWDLDAGTQISAFDAPGTTKASFVGDDALLTLTEGRFRLWSLRDRRSRTLRGHKQHVFSAVFSGDSRALVTNAPWSKAKLWDPVSGLALSTLDANICEAFSFDRSGHSLLVSRSGFYATKGLVGARLPVLNYKERPPGASFLVRRSDAALQVDDGALRDAHERSLGVEGAPVVFRSEHRLGGEEARTRVWRDGVELTRDVPASPAISIGSHPNITFGNYKVRSCVGSFQEVLVFDGPLSVEDGASVDAYLMARKRGQNPPAPNWASFEGSKLVAQFRVSKDSVELEGGQLRAWRSEKDPARKAIRFSMTPGVDFLPGAAPAANAAERREPAKISFHAAWGAAAWLEAPMDELVGKSCFTVCWLGTQRPTKMHNVAYRISSFQDPFVEAQADRRVRKFGATLSVSSDWRYRAHCGYWRTGDSIIVRDLRTGRVVHEVREACSSLCFHPSLPLLACGKLDGDIDVYEVGAWRRVAQIEAHRGSCYDVAYSPDGKRLASGGSDNALRLWDAQSHKALLELRGHRSYVRGVAWSPDGTMLASACGDYDVRIWDSVSRQERYAQQLGQRELEAELRPEIEELRAKHAGRDALVGAIHARWPEDVERVRAALRLLARED